jgi:hypothetical protein
MQKRLLAVGMAMVLALAFAGTAGAQLTVTQNSNATDLANALLAPGMTLVGTPTLTGAPEASGTFVGGNAPPAGLEGIGIAEGVILSSGKVIDADEPNGPDRTFTIFGNPGDGDLDLLIPGYKNLDAVSLEFTFATAVPGNLKFKYVFASEEYFNFPDPAYDYNDVFGLFLKTVDVWVNFAVVPSTTIPISVNNINIDTNPASYRGDNPRGSLQKFDVTYDGLTVVMTATKDLPAGEHTLKLAIADGGPLDEFDQDWDSGVFIERATFTPSGDAQEAAFDLKPGSCPNAFNPKDKSVVPAAILGSETFDVTTIDPASVQLCNAGGDCFSPIRTSIEDAAQPCDEASGDCACCEYYPDPYTFEFDGYLDLALKFAAADIKALVGSAAVGAKVPLTVKFTADDTQFEATDCLKIAR